MHQHLVDPATRQLVCSCDACAVLFSSQEGARFRRVPRDARALDRFHMTEGQWDSLGIPIGLAYFFRSTPQAQVVAFYPSPAGATESLLSLERWNDIVAENPSLVRMEPDVEALLVNRVSRPGRPSPSYFIVPIDSCYRLVGLIRKHWRGFTGGTEVWQEVDGFFDRLQATAQPDAEAR